MTKTLKSKIKKFFFSHCPKPILHAVIRSQLQINYDHDPSLVVKIAETKEELEGAFQVLYRSYLEMGYCDKSEAEMRLTIHHALPTTSILIAKVNEKVVGTLTLVRNNNLKLPCQKEWNIDFLKTADRRVAEITSLAIDKEYRRVKNGNIFLPILKFMYEFSTECFGTEILAIVIHPKEKALYEGLFFFTPIDDRIVPDYYGAPAIALYLDLVATKPVYKKHYNNKKTNKNLYHFFRDFKSKSLIMPMKNSFSVDYPVLDKDLFNYFFFQKSQVGHEVDQETLQKILSHYPSRDQLRGSSRFTVDIEALLIDPLTSKEYPVMIKNISSSGLRIITLNQAVPFEVGEKDYYIQFQSGDSFIKMAVSYQWNNQGIQAGFKIKSSQLGWYRFLKKIHLNYAFSEDIRDVFSLANIKLVA